MAWIKCNLPWTYHNDLSNLPEPPKFDKQIKKLFGKTINEVYKELPKADYTNPSKEYKAASRKYRAFAHKVQAWVKEQPESKAYNEAMKRIDEEDAKKSFCGRGLNKPGTMIEISDEEDKRQLLIGDVNCLGGVCDDCMGFSKDVIVLRYSPVV